MLTLLIRTSHRPKQFNSLLQSIHNEADILVSYDNHKAVEYIPEGMKKFYIEPSAGQFQYNTYVNNLKEQITKGWMLVADDDDLIIPGALQKLNTLLETQLPGALIIQFMRGTYLKPHPAIFEEQEIKMGHIGFPSLVLHSDCRNAAIVRAGEYADYYYIRDIADRVPTVWVKGMAVVRSEKRGRGIME